MARARARGVLQPSSSGGASWRLTPLTSARASVAAAAAAAAAAARRARASGPWPMATMGPEEGRSWKASCGFQARAGPAFARVPGQATLVTGVSDTGGGPLVIMSYQRMPLGTDFGSEEAKYLAKWAATFDNLTLSALRWIDLVADQCHGAVEGASFANCIHTPARRYPRSRGWVRTSGLDFCARGRALGKVRE